MKKEVLEAYPLRKIEATKEDLEQAIFIIECMLEWLDICKGGKIDFVDTIQKWTDGREIYFAEALKLAAECVKEKYLSI